MSALEDVEYRFVLELQWWGGDGKPRHIAFTMPEVLWGLGFTTLAAFILFAITMFAVSDYASQQIRFETALHENAQLLARQEAQRKVANELAQEAFWSLRKGRRIAKLAGPSWPSGPSLEEDFPRPPARGASNDAILAWLSDHAERMESELSESFRVRIERE